MPQDHPILAGDHASRWMGIEVELAEFGHARIRMTLREEMLNGFGIAHGGMIFAFADTCFALACNDPAGDGATITVASGGDINFLSSARSGQVLTAVGTVRAQAGRSGVYDVQVLADGVPVAEFRGRSRTVPNPARKPVLQSAQQPVQQSEEA
jgi:acyl-CoA thioesterase